jgi:hypothetical protein
MFCMMVFPTEHDCLHACQSAFHQNVMP